MGINARAPRDADEDARDDEDKDEDEDCAGAWMRWCVSLNRA